MRSEPMAFGSRPMSIAQAVRQAGRLGGVVTPVVSALQAVRNLDTSNGGSLDVSILNFGKAGKVFSDASGTEAGEGDSVELVLDDVSDAPFGDEQLGDPNMEDAAGWSVVGGGGTLSAVDNGDGTITFTETAGTAITVGHSSATDSTDDAVHFVQWSATAVTGDVTIRIGSNVDATVSVGDGQAYLTANTASTVSRIRLDANASVTLSSASVKEVLGYALQTSAASQPTLETDPFGTLVAATDGVDDEMDLASGLFGDGTKHISFSIAGSLEEAPTTTEMWVGATNSGNPGFEFRYAGSNQKLQTATFGSGGTNGSIDYDRAVTLGETCIMSGTYNPDTATARVYINGQLVAERTDAPTSLSDMSTSSHTLFGRGGASLRPAATCHGLVVMTGDSEIPDASRATAETYLASLTGDTLLDAAPLTVLRRVATPATDLNVSEGFDYADTAALTAVWDDDSSNGHSIAQGSSALQLIPNASGGGRPTAEHIAGYPCRVGYRYTVTPTGDATFMSLGTTKGGNDIVNSASGSSAQTFVASADRVFISFEGAVAGQPTQEVTGVEFEEIARTTALYDFLDETKMTDSSGATQELDSGIEIVLPSVADDPYGSELIGDPTMTDAANWSVFSGNGTITDNGDGTITFTDTVGGSGTEFTHSGSTSAVGDGLYRIVYTASDLTGTNELRWTNASNDYQLSEGSDTEFHEVSGLSPVDPITIRCSDGASVTLSALSVKEVLNYPLRQTSAASQPELQYAPHQYLDGVVFSGRETSERTLDTPVDDDFTSYADQTAAEAAGWIFNDAAITFDAANDEADWSGAQSSNARLGFSVDDLEEGDYVLVTWTVANYSAGDTFATFVNVTSNGGGSGNGTYAWLFGPVASGDTGTQEFGVVGNPDFIGSVTDIKIQRGVRDLSGNDNGPVVNGTLTVSTPEVTTASVASDDFTSYSSIAEVLAVSTHSDQSQDTGVLSLSGGEVGISGGASGTGVFTVSFPATSGNKYRVTAVNSASSPSAISYRVGTTPDGFDITNGSISSDASLDIDFTATASTIYVSFRNGSNNVKLISSYSIVGRADADATVYSGFSGSNYLETADDTLTPGVPASNSWSLSGVIETESDSASGNYFLDYGDWSGSAFSGGRIAGGQVSGLLEFTISDDGNSTRDTLTSTTNIATGEFIPFSLVNDAGTYRLYIAGVEEDSVAATNATGDLSGGIMRIGRLWNSTGLTWSAGSVGTIRFDTSGYAPTAAEIASLHADLAQIYSGVAGSYQYAETVFDGVDDEYLAVGDIDSLATELTGDLTVLWHATPGSATGSNDYILGIGDPAAIGLNLCIDIGHNNTNQLIARVADASSSASITYNTSGGVAGGGSLVRDGTTYKFEHNVTDVGESTQAQAAATGASPQFVVGNLHTAQNSFNYDGAINLVQVVAGALPTGLLVHMQRARDEHINGVTE